MRKVSLIALLLICASAMQLQAQTQDAEMADALRSNGKIYVVVLVLATIFAGIIAYLVRLELKMNKLEKSK